MNADRPAEDEHLEVDHGGNRHRGFTESSPGLGDSGKRLPVAALAWIASRSPKIACGAHSAALASVPPGGQWMRPLSRRAAPTSASLPYIVAVSTCR